MEPVIYNGSTTPQEGDSENVLLVKILGRLINTAGTANNANLPRSGDTNYDLYVKILRVLTGV